MTAELPDSSWVSRLPLFLPLRGSMPGRMFGLVVVVAGLGLLGLAWLQLLRHVSPRDAGAGAAQRVATVRWAAALWTAPLLLAPPLFSRDGWSYAAQGALTALDLSPYIWGPGILDGPIVEAVDPRWMATPAPYGPLPLVWGAGLVGLTHDPWLLVLGHRLLAVLGLAMLAYAVPRLARRAGQDPGLASWLVLASPLMLAHGVAGLHNDLAMAGLMAVALTTVVERRWVLAAALVGAAAAVKLPGGLVGVAVVLASLPAAASTSDRVRRTVGVGAASFAVLVGLGVVSGLGVGWLHALGVPGEVRTPMSATTQLGQLLELLLGLAGADSVAVGVVELVRGLGALAILGLAGWLVLHRATGPGVEPLRAGSFLMLATVLLSPVVHHWYALWCVPLLAACPLGRRAVTALVAASLLLGLVAPLDSSLHGATVAIVVTTVLVAGVAAPLLGLLRGLVPWPEAAAELDEDRVGEGHHAATG